MVSNRDVSDAILRDLKRTKHTWAETQKAELVVQKEELIECNYFKLNTFLKDLEIRGLHKILVDERFLIYSKDLIVPTEGNHPVICVIQCCVFLSPVEKRALWRVYSRRPSQRPR